VLSALKDILRSEFLNSSVMNFVCRPTYVNLAVFVLTSLCVFVTIVRLILFKKILFHFNIDYPLLSRYILLGSLSSYMFYP